ISDADVTAISDALAALGGIGGTLYGVYGRVKATKAIGCLAGAMLLTSCTDIQQGCVIADRWAPLAEVVAMANGASSPLVSATEAEVAAVCAAAGGAVAVR